MTHDPSDSKPDDAVTVAPELEARLVAWVAGEIDDFEQRELEKLVAARPELAAFKRRIELVRELVVAAQASDPEPLRLSAERREKLLKTLGATAEVLPLREQVVVLPPRRPWWSGRDRRRYFMLGGLAVGCLAALLRIATEKPVFEERADVLFERAERSVQSVQGVVDADIRSAAGEAKVAAVRRANDGTPGTTAYAPAQTVLGPSPRTEPLHLPLAVQFEAPAPPPLQFSMPGLASAAVAKADSPASLKVKKEGDADVFRFGRPVGGGVVLGSSPGDTNFADAVGSARASGLVAGNAVAPVTTVNGRDLTLGLGTKDLTTADKARESSAPMATGAVAVTAATSKVENEVIQLSAFSVSAPAPAAKGLARAGSGGRRSADEARAPGRPAEGRADLKQKAAAEARVDPVVPAAQPAMAPPPVDAETSTRVDPNSTFSLHVSDVSFRLAQAALAALERGENERSLEIRPEEFYNAFDYGDPAPAPADQVVCRVEQSAHPVLQQRNLLRIAMKVAATGRNAAQPLRLTVLLDTSGSMEREDRVAAVRRALEVLVSLLKPEDRLTLVGFARQPRLLAENLPGDQARTALEILARTPADGGTNIEEALKLGGELARRHFAAGAQNRIVVLTDGAANLGNAEPAGLMAGVETLRQQGIAFDACGVGLEGTGDTVLEALTRRGNGRYYVINSAEAADAGFARQLAGAFRPAAENVKVQVRFNPGRVGHHRLIGFEAHRLRTEDFRDDRVDAAELAAEEAAVALYQVEVLPDGTGELGEVFVRFRDPATGGMVERSWTMPFAPQAAAFGRAAPSLQLAGLAALLAEKFRASPLAGQFKLGEFAGVMGAVRAHYAHEPRVQELATMFAQVRKFTGE